MKTAFNRTIRCDDTDKAVVQKCISELIRQVLESQNCPKTEGIKVRVFDLKPFSVTHKIDMKVMLNSEEKVLPGELINDPRSHLPYAQNCGTAAAFTKAVKRMFEEDGQTNIERCKETLIKIFQDADNDTFRDLLFRNGKRKLDFSSDDSSPVVLYQEKCSECRGKGTLKCIECKGKGELTCRECRGRGTVKHTERVRVGTTAKGDPKYRNETTDETCPVCDGEGKIKCTSCRGKGYTVCRECKGFGYMTKGVKLKILCNVDLNYSASDANLSSDFAGKKAVSLLKNKLSSDMTLREFLIEKGHPQVMESSSYGSDFLSYTVTTSENSLYIANAEITVNNIVFRSAVIMSEDLSECAVLNYSWYQRVVWDNKLARHIKEGAAAVCPGNISEYIDALNNAYLLEDKKDEDNVISTVRLAAKQVLNMPASDQDGILEEKRRRFESIEGKDDIHGSLYDSSLKILTDLKNQYLFKDVMPKFGLGHINYLLYIGCFLVVCGLNFGAAFLVFRKTELNQAIMACQPIILLSAAVMAYITVKPFVNRYCTNLKRLIDCYLQLDMLLQVQMPLNTEIKKNTGLFGKAVRLISVVIINFILLEAVFLSSIMYLLMR